MQMYSCYKHLKQTRNLEDASTLIKDEKSQIKG